MSKDTPMNPSDACTQEIYNRTLLYAAEAHGGQLFSGTQLPYVVHVTMVANEVIFAHHEEAVKNGILALQMALLHDVLEDTAVTTQQLCLHFEGPIVDGVILLSKTCNGKKIPFAEYIERLAHASKEVGLVKLCDRIVNLQRPPKFWTTEKIASYLEESRVILKALGHHHTYAANRLASKIDHYRQYLST